MRRMLAGGCLVAVTALTGLAQGPLNPSGPPAPGMRTLQELWDIVTASQIQIANLQSQVDALTNQIEQTQAELSAGLEGVSQGEFAARAAPMILTLVSNHCDTAQRSPMVLSSGAPYIAYGDSQDAQLKLLAYTTAGRVSDTVTGAVPVGISMVLNASSSELLISRYTSGFGSANGGVEVLYGIPGSWTKLAVETNGVADGTDTSLALAASGQPAVSYASWTGEGFLHRKLRYAGFDGSQWIRYTVDDSGDVGVYSSLAFSGPLPCISYYDRAEGNLKYAQWNGSAWVTEVVDAAGDVGLFTSLKIAPDGRPAISYYGNGDLKFAKWDGSSWDIQTVDSEGDVGLYPSLDFVADRPAIAYFDSSRGDLKYAEWSGSRWRVRTVDASPPFQAVGLNPTLKVNPSGVPVISYQDQGQGSIKYVELPAN